jgi:hypothetical protein
MGGMWFEFKRHYGRQGSLTAFAPCESPSQGTSVALVVTQATIRWASVLNDGWDERRFAS